MKFCNDCNNMLYLNIVQSDIQTEPDKINYICKNCNFQCEHNKSEDSSIFSIDYNIDNIKKNSFINPFIYEDITLPRAEGIKCPNENCGVAAGKKPEIIYIKYDNDNMKFIYICLDCHKNPKPGNEKHIW